MTPKPISVRLPPEIYQHLKDLAQSEKRSINAIAIEILQNGLEQKTTPDINIIETKLNFENPSSSN